MEKKPVALVTGSSRGIGRYVAEQLTLSGYCVVGCSRNEPDIVLQNYSHVLADIGEEKQVKRLLKYIEQQYGRLDVTVNNAGIASMNHSLLIPSKTAEYIMRTNFHGTFLVSRESAKLMRRRYFGRIINLTTVAVPINLEGESIYVASKGAIEALTRVMSRELAGFGITVNAIGPTPIETDLLRNVPQEKIESILNSLAIKRLGRLSDVFNVVEFLIKPESEYITGQVIYLGGA